MLGTSSLSGPWSFISCRADAPKPSRCMGRALPSSLPLGAKLRLFCDDAGRASACECRLDLRERRLPVALLSLPDARTAKLRLP